MLAFISVYGVVRAYRHLSRRAATTLATKVLEKLRLDEDMPPLEKIRQLSCLLRRVAISTGIRSEVAGLHGMAWLSYLDQSLPGTSFTQGCGRILAQGPFRQTYTTGGAGLAEKEVMALMQLTEQWIKAQA